MRTLKPNILGDIPSATGGITRLACARLRERGRNTANILTRAGLTATAVDDLSVRLEAQAQIEVLDLAAQELDDDVFGFHLARNFDLREIGLVYYVMASSEQLADALRNAERYSGIVNEGVRLSCDLSKGASIALQYREIQRLPDWHHTEFWLVTLIRLCRELTDNRLVPRGIKVRHMRPNMPAEFRSFFRTEIQFGSDADEITLSTPMASLPIVGRDTYLNRLLRRYADEALPRVGTRRSGLRAKIERGLLELLPHGKASLPEVARRLGISPRTLSRKLRDEGTSFVEIREDLRKALALRYLVERELPVSEIAWLLGYEEVSSLTHAFRRWSGMTPRQFRLSRHDGTEKKGSDRRQQRSKSLHARR